MNTSLAFLAPTLDRTAAQPDWRQNEDRYYVRVSHDWPTLATLRHVLIALRHILVAVVGALHTLPTPAHGRRATAA